MYIERGRGGGLLLLIYLDMYICGRKPENLNAQWFLFCRNWIVDTTLYWAQTQTHTSINKYISSTCVLYCERVMFLLSNEYDRKVYQRIDESNVDAKKRLLELIGILFGFVMCVGVCVRECVPESKNSSTLLLLLNQIPQCISITIVCRNSAQSNIHGIHTNIGSSTKCWILQIKQWA